MNLIKCAYLRAIATVRLETSIVYWRLVDLFDEWMLHRGLRSRDRVHAPSLFKSADESSFSKNRSYRKLSAGRDEIYIGGSQHNELF